MNLTFYYVTAKFNRNILTKHLLKKNKLTIYSMISQIKLYVIILLYYQNAV